MNPNLRQQTLDTLHEEKRILMAARIAICVLLVDHNDLAKAGMALVAAILAGLFVEWHFGYVFFSDVLRLGWAMAIVLPLAVVFAFCTVFKFVQEYAYREAQYANVQIRDFQSGPDRENIFLSDKLEEIKSKAHEQYTNTRLALKLIGGAIFGAGIVMLALERVHLQDNSGDITWLTYGFNIAFTIGGAILAACTWHYVSKRNYEVGKIHEINDRLQIIQIHETRILGEGGESSTPQPSGPQNPGLGGVDRVFVVGEGGKSKRADQIDTDHGAAASDSSRSVAGGNRPNG